VTGATVGTLGVGILGAGRMGERHATAIGRTPGLRVVAIHDPAKGAAERLGAATGAAVAPTIDELVNGADVSIVAVCSPTPYHLAQVRVALDAGRDVLCEKPLAQTAAEVDELVDLAEANGRILGVGYLYRHAPAFVRMASVVRAGALGDLHLALFRIGGRGGHQVWKHTRDAGGGATFDMLSHMIDLACWMLGPAHDIRLLSHATVLPEREIAGSSHRVDAEDYVVAQWRTAAGAICLCQGDLASPAFMQYAEIHGSNGSAFGSILDDLPTLLYLRNSAGGVGAGSQRLDEPASQPIEAQWLAFRDRVHDRRADELDGIRTTAHVIDALRRAQGEGIE
jgi:myo-inositol 2-dehydrogenase / D-chiro-inositol 1-dehydrogenase